MNNLGCRTRLNNRDCSTRLHYQDQNTGISVQDWVSELKQLVNFKQCGSTRSQEEFAVRFIYLCLFRISTNTWNGRPSSWLIAGPQTNLVRYTILSCPVSPLITLHRWFFMNLESGYELWGYEQLFSKRNWLLCYNISKIVWLFF